MGTAQKKSTDLCYLEKYPKIIGGNFSFLLPLRAPMSKIVLGGGLVLYSVWPFFQICNAIWKNGHLEKCVECVKMCSKNQCFLCENRKICWRLGA